MPGSSSVIACQCCFARVDSVRSILRCGRSDSRLSITARLPLPPRYLILMYDPRAMHAPHSRRRATGFACVAMAAVALAVTSGCAERTPVMRHIALTECRLPKVAQAVQCGSVEVPENRDQPQGRRLSIFVAILPANTLTPKPDPLVLLAGGPGQAASTLGPFASQLTAVRRTRDIVLIDQRGTGRSSPLSCPALAPDEHAEFDTDPVPKATLCAQQLGANGVDASQY